LNEQGIIDSTAAVRSALVDTASAIRTALNDHITNDEDTDSTNEYNTGFEVNGTGDSLIITDAGTRFAVAIEDVDRHIEFVRSNPIEQRFDKLERARYYRFYFSG
jgi:hypothetical protein